MEKGIVDMIKPRQYGDWLRAEPLGRRGYLSNSNLEKRLKSQAHFEVLKICSHKLQQNKVGEEDHEAEDTAE